MERLANLAAIVAILVVCTGSSACDTEPLVPPDPPTPRESLEVLYDATNGSGWTTNYGWITEQPLHDWYGLDIESTFDTDESVVGLRLRDNNLRGTIPPAIGHLGSLVRLDLSRNPALVGALPVEIGNLTKLEELWLGPGIGGPVPRQIGRLTSLRRLFLGDQLTGPIPPEIGQLSSLTWLDLSDNHLSGSVPSELGRLTSLEILAIQDNRLTGPLPPEIGQLTRLRSFYLSGNDLAGIPAEVGNLTELRVMSLEHNRLTSIPAEIGSMDKLAALGLLGNTMSGPLPIGLLDKLPNLQWLSLSGNDFTGSIPPAIGKFPAWRNGPRDTSVTPPQRLYLSDNRLTGRIPVEMGALVFLHLLDIANNNLDGPLPASIGAMTQLEELYLGGNNLSGPLPPELADLRWLNRLGLEGNRGLSGPLPPDMVNLRLDYLNLGDTGLCVPDTDAFREWTASISEKIGVSTCPASTDFIQGSASPPEMTMRRVR